MTTTPTPTGREPSKDDGSFAWTMFGISREDLRKAGPRRKPAPKDTPKQEDTQP